MDPTVGELSNPVRRNFVSYSRVQMQLLLVDSETERLVLEAGDGSIWPDRCSEMRMSLYERRKQRGRCGQRSALFGMRSAWNSI